MKLTKTPEEARLMKISGKICAQALSEVLKELKIGSKCSDLDNIARREIEEKGGKSSFMTVDDYKWTICTTINDQVVHGIPTERQVADGDIIGIDIGAIYNGYHSDMAITIPVGKVSEKTRKFLEIGKETLFSAIKKAKVGARIGDISEHIQKSIEGAGYSIVKNLTGHGIGRELHEEPMIPGFGKSGLGQEILEGMALAVEVIYAERSGQVYLENDGWTISTKDGSLGGLFEQSILTTKNGPIVLTPYL